MSIILHSKPLHPQLTFINLSGQGERESAPTERVPEETRE